MPALTLEVTTSFDATQGNGHWRTEAAAGWSAHHHRGLREATLGRAGLGECKVVRAGDRRAAAPARPQSVHPTFGEGTVLDQRDDKLRIDFGAAGIKTIAERFIKTKP